MFDETVTAASSLLHAVKAIAAAPMAPNANHRRIIGVTLLPRTLLRMSPMHELGARSKAAARVLAGMSSAAKDAGLHAGADLLVEREEVLDANHVDVQRAEAGGASAAIVDRLRLTPARVDAMAAGLRKVASLPDPVGEVADGWVRPNGLRVRRVRVPLGVVAIVYENRPNVTSDAAGLCVKSGNAAFLRGSSGAISSNIAVAGALRDGFLKAGLPSDSLVLVEDTSY
jgi:glutamate-5-semialdehyde dehydrogenase